MKRINLSINLTFLIAILLLSAGSLYAFIDDPEYHQLDEIWEEIFALQEEFPQWLRVDSIGHSQEEGLPIYAVRITYDVHEPPGDKPPVVFIGQVHAEEVLGVEFCMWLMQKMVTQEFLPRKWRDEVDTYIIPTANPEGLNVVYETDYSYRKNKRDNIGDSFFRWFPGWGSDTSGVDINRNFPLNWAKGDKLLVKGSQELYDYYRGPAPASESETQALIRFYDKIRPFYGMTIHSSRTGNVAEQVIYPWAYGEGADIKFSPDIDVYDELARQVANRCEKYGSPGVFYPVIRVGHPRGDLDTYMYYRFGAFSMRIEIGDQGEAMQPDSAGIHKVIGQTRLGFEYLLNSAGAEIEEDEKGEINWSRIDIHVIDPDGSPLEARVALKNWITPTIPHRTTNPITGRYYWLSYSGYSDSLYINKFGYEPQVRQVNVGANPVRRRVALEPLDWYDVQLNITDLNGMTVTEPIEMTVSHRDTSWSTTINGGQHDMFVPEGSYRLSLFAQNYVSRQVELSVDSSGIQTIGLSFAAVLLDQPFDGNRVVYTSDNSKNFNGNGGDSLKRWEVTDDIFHSPPRCLTDTRLGNVLPQEDGWCSPYNSREQSFDLSSAGTASLTYWLNQALEPGFDSMWVEVWVPDSGWMQIETAHQRQRILEDVPIREWNAPPINYQQYHPWERVLIPLDDWCGPQSEQFHFRFRIKSDLSVTTDGVYIDDVRLTVSGNAPPSVSSEPIIPLNFTLSSPYPNPFNSRVTVRASLPEAELIETRLFDITGRQVFNRSYGEMEAGVHELSIYAGHLSNGLYILQVSSPGQSKLRKVMLLK